MNTFNKLTLFANIVLVILTFGAYLAPYLHPDTSVILAILGLVYPALLIANVLFVIYWLFVNPKWVIGSFLTLLIGYQSILGLVGFSFNNPINNKEVSTLNLASFNMQLSIPLRMIKEKERFIQEKEYEKYLSQFKAIDVLCLQEHSPLGQKHIEATLDFPYRHYSEKNFIAIYSKFPIINKGSLQDFSKSEAMDCIWVDIILKKDTIRIYSTHFEANKKDGKIAGAVILNKKQPPFDYSMAIGLLTFYQKFSSKRVDQVQQIKAHQKNSPFPTILCGDVNDTPQSYVYRILADGKKDTFRAHGRGIGATFGSTLKNKLAFLRIDYILSDPSFKIIDHTIYPGRFSDHSLITASMHLE